MQMALPVLLLACTVSAIESGGFRGTDSWNRALAEKAALFERTAEERHNILGTYPSSVRLVPPQHYVDPEAGGWDTFVETSVLPSGWTIDHGASGPSNVAHTSSWTGCLLTAEAFHVAYLRDTLGADDPEYKKAYDRASEIIQGLRILTLVSGQPGYLARGLALGHGISYEERAGVETRDLWRQGKGEYRHLRYRGGPSHHNYDQVFRGLGTYYFVAADDAQKEAIRAIVADMSDWAHIKHGFRVMLEDGKRESTVLIGGWQGWDGDTEPSGGSLMATTGLKIAYMITGNPEVKKLHDYWVDRLGYRDAQRTAKNIMGSGRGNYDDTDHLLSDLYLLNLIEEDPDLLRFYRKCVKDSWEAYKDGKMAWFNYIYGAVLGVEYADVEGSLWNLQTFPTCRIFQPQLNSIRTDIEFTTNRRGRKEALEPLPCYERASDNEYEWKNSPYSLDGWLARIVSVVEVCPLDSYVLFAADESGGAYSSITNGAIWRDMEGLPRVRDFMFSPDYPGIAFAATDGGVFRTMDQGRKWERVLSQPAARIRIAPFNTHIVYAVTTDGIYKSPDFGEKALGVTWRRVTDEAVPEKAVFALGFDDDQVTLYMLTPNGLFWREESATDWNHPDRLIRPRSFGGFSTVGGDPNWLRADETTPARLFRSVNVRGVGPLLSVSEDAGQTWTSVVREINPWVIQDVLCLGDSNNVMLEEEFRGYRKIARDLPIRDIVVDAWESNRWYGLLDSGVAVTEDAGETWTVSNEGLHIPRVQTLWRPRSSSDLFVGTPAGLYVSHDSGQTWEDTALIPQYPDGAREEIGGAGYLEAYWLGRLEGFISDEEASRAFWE